MTRAEVYTIIDEEREYQENLGALRSEANGQKRVLEVGEYITMLQHYVNHAATEWTTKSGSEAALHDFRKIAAIAVRCMENHGVPRR